MIQMEFLLYVSSGAIGALATLVVTGLLERSKRKREVHATERHAVAAFLGRVAEVQHRIEVLSTNAASNAREALPAFESIHNARMALLTEYARTRLDVTTPMVRNSLGHTFRTLTQADQIMDDGAAGEPYPVTVRRLIVLNSQVSNCCEDLVRACEATIGPARLNRRERKRAMNQPALGLSQNKGEGRKGRNR